MVDTKHFQGPGFIMYVPTDWFISSSLQYQAIFLAPLAEDGTRANMTISMRELEEDASFQDYMASVKQTREQNYENYELLDEADYTQTGGMGFQHVFKWYSETQERTIVQVQAVFLIGDVLFTLTGSVAEVHAEDYVPVFTGMIDTFRVPAPETSGE